MSRWLPTGVTHPAKGLSCRPSWLQAQTLNFLLDGFDLVGRARTGCGKTLAFVLPIVERLGEDTRRQHGRAPKVIVLAPTRELAKQASRAVLRSVHKPEGVSQGSRHSACETNHSSELQLALHQMSI